MALINVKLTKLFAGICMVGRPQRQSRDAGIGTKIELEIDIDLNFDIWTKL